MRPLDPLRKFPARKWNRRVAARNFAMAVVSLALAAGGTHALLLNAQSTAPIPAFDLMWDPVTGVDANSLPLGPVWRLQKARPELPDFKAFCGPAFSPLYDRTITNYAAFTANCSSQGPTMDLPITPIPCDFSTSKVLAGHLNWGITTHKGLIYWSEYDNFDGDFNFELIQPDHAAETALNNGTEYGIHLEFKGNETMANFRSDFWTSFYKEAMKSHHEADNVAVSNMVSGKRAVITGLLGVDGVHGGYTELHPVFSMAIETQRQSVQGGVDASWAFFLRNQGGEGCCSSHVHQWDGLSDVNGGWNWYFIQLPLPPELERARSTASVLPRSLLVWANAGLIGPVISQDAKWVYLGFRLPEPAVAPELDGVISLHYAVQNPPAKLYPRPLVSKLTMLPRGDDWEEVRKHMRPADLNKLDEAVRGSQLASVKPRPHTLLLAVPSSPSIVSHQRLIGPGHKGQLTRTKTFVDPADAAAREQLGQSVRPMVPKEILEPKRQF